MAEYIRLQNDSIQSPIIELTHPEESSTISLVGMAHMGMRTYYDTVAAYVAGKEEAGAAVHYERVSVPKPDTLTWDSQEDRLRYEKLYAVRCNDAVESFLCRHIGLVHQRQALTYPESWQNHDMHGVQYARELGTEGVRSMARQAAVTRAIIHCLDVALPKSLKSRLARGVFKATVDVVAAKGVKTLTDQKDIVSITRRSQIALEAVRIERQQKSDQDFVLLWGSGHFPDFMRGFTEDGYEETNRQWVDVITHIG